jgi:hypothetical protein
MVFSARRVLVAALLVVAAVIWVRINKPVEGDVLLEVTSRHGVTVADLLSLVMLAMAMVIVWPSRRPRPMPSSATPVRRPSPQAAPPGRRAAVPQWSAPPRSDPPAPTRRL